MAELKKSIIKLYEHISSEKFQELKGSFNCTYHLKDEETGVTITYNHVQYTIKHYGQAEKLCELLLLGSIDIDRFCSDMIKAGFFTSLFLVKNIIPYECIVKYDIFSYDTVY